MEKAIAEQDDEVQQREGGVVFEVAEAATHLRRELSPLRMRDACLEVRSLSKAAWSDSEMGRGDEPWAC